MRLLLLSFVLAVATSSFAEDVEIPCSRVDLRSRSKEIGWPRTPHQGGRASALALTTAEAVGMKLGLAVTPLDFDRALARGESIELAVTRIAASGFCPLAEGPMDDVAFSREPSKVPATGCDKNPERRLPPTKLSLEPIELAKIDSLLDAGSPVLVAWEAEFDRVEGIVVARRFDTEQQRCEWLVRNMGGPFCRRWPCEDGASWVPRKKLVFHLPRVVR